MKIMIGIMFIAYGLYLFIRILKGDSKNKVKASLYAAVFLITGALMSGLKLLGYEKASSLMVILTVAFVAILLAIIEIIPVIKCSLEVEGEFVGVEAKPVKGGARYGTKFIYEVNGQTYKSNSIDDFTKRYVKKKYEEGNKYYIFVDPKNPEKFLSKRSVTLDTILLLITGIIFLVIAYCACSLI